MYTSKTTVKTQLLILHTYLVVSQVY